MFVSIQGVQLLFSDWWPLQKVALFEDVQLTRADREGQAHR